jgi:hypothetical protein
MSKLMQIMVFIKWCLVWYIRCIKSDLCIIYLLCAFPFLGTFLIGKIGIDFYDADQWDSSYCRDTCRSNCGEHFSWKMICNLHKWIGRNVCHCSYHHTLHIQYVEHSCQLLKVLAAELVDHLLSNCCVIHYLLYRQNVVLHAMRTRLLMP